MDDFSVHVRSEDKPNRSIEQQQRPVIKAEREKNVSHKRIKFLVLGFINRGKKEKAGEGREGKGTFHFHGTTCYRSDTYLIGTSEVLILYNNLDI